MDWRSPCRRWSIGSTKGESEGRTAIHWFPHWRSIEAGGGYIKSVTLEDHEQALTEKGREIQQIREHEFQNGYREGEAAMMAQAVRFAALVCECWGSNCNMIDAQEYEEARTFLKERL